MKRYISIENKRIGDRRPVFIIAEAGVNHNGSLKLAKKMIEAAKLSGADAVKFQVFRTEDLVTKDALKPGYQRKKGSGKSQFEMLKQLELSGDGFRILARYCKDKKITFLATPFDFRSAEFLYKINVPAFKIGSGDLTNIPLLLQIARYQRPIILSTGMATLEEVRQTVKAIYSTGNRKMIILHCTSDYPAKYEDINLKAMDTLRKEFGVPVGYSDHTEGIEISIAALIKGACVIEKHFTLDRNFLGPDHKASLEPDEFRNMVRAIRNTEKAMGDGVKRSMDSEERIKKLARKSIVAACDISKGTSLSLDMLSVKRPGRGIEPRYLNRLINRKTNVKLKKDQILTWSKLDI